MRRWGLRHLAALAIVGALVGFLAPVSASAGTQTHPALHIRTGTTTVTTAPGVATALLGKSIVPFVTAPGHSTLILPSTGPALVASYPVTGGSVGLNPPRGVIRHSGGLLLINLANGKMIQVNNFIIDIKAAVLTAHVVGTTARVPVFKLDLRHAVISVRHHVITISRVGLLLTKTAATALNGALGTTVFAQNLFFGTARTKLVVH
jgi:hypothetical protein